MATSYIGRDDLPPGLRNNNPGNLRPGSNWLGKVGTTGGFLVFSDITWGLRAMAIVIRNDIKKGLNTIRLYIGSYAPASENPTDSYISRVASATGINADTVLVPDVDTLRSLMKAQIAVEVGPAYASYVKDSDIDQGLALMSSPVLAATTAAAQNPVETIIILGIAGYVGYKLFKSLSRKTPRKRLAGANL
jgi:hypothetical protein